MHFYQNEMHNVKNCVHTPSVLTKIYLFMYLHLSLTIFNIRYEYYFLIGIMCNEIFIELCFSAIML